MRCLLLSDILGTIFLTDAINRNILIAKVFDIFQHGLPLNPFDVHMLECHIGDRCISESSEIERVLRIDAATLFRQEPVNRDITKIWQVFAISSFFIEEVGMNNSQPRLIHDAVLHIDIVQCPAPLGVRLEPDWIVKVRAVKVVILSEHIMDTTRYLAPDCYSAMSIAEPVAAAANVFGWYASAAAILIAAGLDCNAVISSLEVTILDQHVF